LIVCHRLLEPKPFLIMDFRPHPYSFDGNRDGCADAAGPMPLPKIDPEDVFPPLMEQKSFVTRT
jgi:hypothetical protein